MRVGIMSDTHKKVGRAKQVIELFKSQKVGMIIHAGDIVRVEVLELLKESRIDYIAVYGNNDAKLHAFDEQYNLVQEPYTFMLEHKSVLLMHHPHFIDTKHDIVIYGHTHDFDARLKEHTLILNPGETCARNKPLSECIILDINKSAYHMHYFYRAVKTTQWVEKEKIFKVDHE